MTEVKIILLESLYGADNFNELLEKLRGAEEISENKDMVRFAKSKNKHLVYTLSDSWIGGKMITLFLGGGYFRNIEYREGTLVNPTDGEKSNFISTKLTWENKINKTILEYVPLEKLIPQDWFREDSIWIGPQ